MSSSLVLGSPQASGGKSEPHPLHSRGGDSHEGSWQGEEKLSKSQGEGEDDIHGEDEEKKLKTVKTVHRIRIRV